MDQALALEDIDAVKFRQHDLHASLGVIEFVRYRTQLEIKEMAC